MIAFASLLLAPAEKAGMSVPDREQVDDWNTEAFAVKWPHFSVFCKLQLGKRMAPGEHWDNAKCIAALSLEEVQTFTLDDFRLAGVGI